MPYVLLHAKNGTVNCTVAKLVHIATVESLHKITSLYQAASFPRTLHEVLCLQAFLVPNCAQSPSCDHSAIVQHHKHFKV